jgi:hypothetical protein
MIEGGGAKCRSCHFGKVSKCQSVSGVEGGMTEGGGRGCGGDWGAEGWGKERAVSALESRKLPPTLSLGQPFSLKPFLPRQRGSDSLRKCQVSEEPYTPRTPTTATSSIGGDGVMNKGAGGAMAMGAGYR